MLDKSAKASCENNHNLENYTRVTDPDFIQFIRYIQHSLQLRCHLSHFLKKRL